MNIKIDQEKCIGCGYCVSVAPEVFRLNEENKSEVIAEADLSQFEDKIKESAQGCPVQAIIAE